MAKQSSHDPDSETLFSLSKHNIDLNIFRPTDSAISTVSTLFQAVLSVCHRVAAFLVVLHVTAERTLDVFAENTALVHLIPVVPDISRIQ